MGDLANGFRNINVVAILQEVVINFQHICQGIYTLFDYFVKYNETKENCATEIK